MGEPPLSAKLDHVLICMRRLSEVSRETFGKLERLEGGVAFFTAGLKLLRCSVIGIGVPQMAEHRLRPQARHLCGLLDVAMSRIRETTMLSWSAQA